ncbi:family 18 glycoside hydrolase [Melampsora americana]|nr:family 18 glycoside hydrolase [Melampsora americana]
MQHLFALFLLVSLDLQVALGATCRARKHHSVFKSSNRSIISVYYPGYNAKYLPVEKIPWKKYDHLHYFVAVPGDTAKDDLKIDTEANMKEVVSAAKAHNVSTSLTVGGWTGSRLFSALVGSEQNRTDFADSISRTVKKYGFNGIDLDWEYPNVQGLGCNLLNKDDSQNFLSFLKVLRSKLGSRSRLSAAVSVHGFMSSDGTNYLNDTSAFSRELDFLTIMAYDLYGPSFSQVAGPNAPLFDTCSEPNFRYSVSQAIKQWTSTGTPARKLILGLPAYGYGYTTLSNKLAPTNFSGKSGVTSQLFQPSSPTVPPAGKTADVGGSKDVCGNITKAGGQWLFKELSQTGKLSTDGQKGLQGYERHYDNCTHTPFLFNPSTRNLISYDDGFSLAEKTKYAIAQGLAGVDIFDATGDSEDNQLLGSIQKAMNRQS